MKHLKHYQTPEVLREVAFAPGASLLDGSVVDKTGIISNGQEIENINAGSSDFDWNNSWNWDQN